jgi:hypothetical protein
MLKSKDLQKPKKISATLKIKSLFVAFLVLKNDPDFRLVLESWPDLSADLKQAIIKMVS